MIKSFLWVGLLVVSLQGAWAYSLGGPIGNNPNPSGVGGAGQGDSWQQPVIGYGLGGDLNAPKNLGEEYRRNVPVMYYACNANFLDFFGSNGVSAVDGAFAILNNAFTNNPTGITNGLDGYTASLSEIPLESRHLNYQAQALGLFDLKSWTLAAMMEQLGLADPVRYDWTLHDRAHVGNVPCPAGQEYLVVQRNFDPVSSPLNQLQYSPYINDVLYSYYITEACTGADPLALANPFSVDPLADTYSPVAALAANLGYGFFFTGLTRDDVGGLRYLLSANNINFESAPAGSILLNSSSGGGLTYGPPVLLYTSNYNAFAMAALTNDPVTLSNLFPGLVIVSSSYYFTNIATPIVVAYFTNLIGAPYGTPTLVVKTNGYTYSFPAIYSYTFANFVILLNGFPNTSASLVTVTVGEPVIGAPYGTLGTNTTTKTVILNNVPSGEYYINTNYLCGPPLFLSTLATNVTATTNFLFAASNSAGFFTSQSLVTSSTTHVYVVQWPICATAVTGGTTNAPGLREGIEKMRFVRANYDSLLGQFFQPIINTFTIVMITNSQVVNQTFQRVVTTPDFIFSAADLATGPSSSPHPAIGTFSRNLNFDQSNVLPGLAGPGLITPSTTITFDKVGPVYYNEFDTGLMDGTPYFTETPGTDGSDLYFTFYFIWASFDGTTNDPVVYPNGTSIQNLVDQILH